MYYTTYYILYYTILYYTILYYTEYRRELFDGLGRRAWYEVWHSADLSESEHTKCMCVCAGA